MPVFTYQSLTSNGRPSSGTISAADRATAVRQLAARGETPTRLDASEGEGSNVAAIALAGAGSQPRRVRRTRARPSLRRTEVANLIRELATAMEAGLPLMSALKTVRRQASGKGMPVILDHLIERVEAGAPLHQAAREYGPPFDDMIVGMLRAADASGEMSGIMHQLADLLERSLELRRSVIGATMYPMIVAVLILISAIILVTYLVPTLIEPLADQIKMPLPTVIVLAVADFLSAYGLFLAAGIVFAIFAWRAWLRIPENRLRFDAAILRVPVYGKLVRDVAVARFTRTLGTLTTAGISILDGLRITRDTLGNEALKKAIGEVQEQVTTGKALAEPLERSGLFPPLLVQIVNLGERSGKLEQMLLHAATAFDRQVQTTIKVFTAILPPALLVVMACLGGFILAAILLPLLEIQSAFSGG
ncbi:MAG: type II secretion system F family protein [Phycisphaerales bacterium]